MTTSAAAAAVRETRRRANRSRAVVDQHFQRFGEPLQLAHPVADDGRRGEEKRGPDAADRWFFPQTRCGRRNRAFAGYSGGGGFAFSLSPALRGEGRGEGFCIDRAACGAKRPPSARPLPGYGGEGVELGPPCRSSSSSAISWIVLPSPMSSARHAPMPRRSRNAIQCSRGVGTAAACH